MGIVLFIGLISLGGCKTDFQINEPYKEKQIIYGLVGYDDSSLVRTLPNGINVTDVYRNDSILYFKIGKAFQNSGGSAYQYASVQDSLYYGDELIATLEEQSGGRITTYNLLRVTSIPKQSGVFAYPGQVLYRTPSGFKVKDDGSYTIKTTNTKTGLKCSANTSIIGYTGLAKFIDLSSGINIATSGTYPITITSTAKNAKFYTVNVNIIYTEVDNGNPIDSVQKRLTWNIAQYLTTATTNGGENLNTSFQSLDFYNFLAQNITVDPHKKRLMKAIEFELLCGGSEIYNYINVNTPALGIVQKIPDYTNVNNGVGIFSSRNRIAYYRKVDPRLTTTLKSLDITKSLNFIY